jgi:hypothetical protein
MWLYLDDVFVDELIVWDDFFGNDISHVHNAVFPFVCVIIEEDVVSLVVGLINKQWF